MKKRVTWKWVSIFYGSSIVWALGILPLIGTAEASDQFSCKIRLKSDGKTTLERNYSWQVQSIPLSGDRGNLLNKMGGAFFLFKQKDQEDRSMRDYYWAHVWAGCKNESQNCEAAVSFYYTVCYKDGGIYALPLDQNNAISVINTGQSEYPITDSETISLSCVLKENENSTSSH